MPDKSDEFVKKAFLDAVRAAGLNSESKVASDSFHKSFRKLIVVAHETLDEEDKKHFINQNNDSVCQSAIVQIVKMFFFAGFKRGIMYQKEKR